MNEYWVIYKDKNDIIPEEIHEAEYFSHNEKIDGHIKNENGIYYGTLTTIHHNHDVETHIDHHDPNIEWIQVDPKHIYSITDMDQVIRLIYVVLWCLVFIRMIMSSKIKYDW